MFSPLLGDTHMQIHADYVTHTQFPPVIVRTHVSANKCGRSKGCHVAQQSNEKLFYYKLPRKKAAGSQKCVCFQQEDGGGWRSLQRWLHFANSVSILIFSFDCSNNLLESNAQRQEKKSNNQIANKMIVKCVKYLWLPNYSFVYCSAGIHFCSAVMLHSNDNQRNSVWKWTFLGSLAGLIFLRG